MANYITHLTDIIGNNYLGVDVPLTIVQPYLNELKDILGEENYSKYTEQQINRDKGSFHITVINVSTYNKLSNQMGIDKFVSSLDPIFKYPIDDLKLMGIGRAQKNENISFFIVCKSDKLDAIRTRYDLSEQDFHITLGFLYKDVQGVPKRELFKKESKFIQLLRDEFYKYECFNFIRDIDNFDLDPRAEIIPVKITDTTIKIKCEGYYMDIGYSDDKQALWIYTKYPIGDIYPRLPETEIMRYFKNIKP
jgi:hypothetical protein